MSLLSKSEKVNESKKDSPLALRSITVRSNWVNSKDVRLDADYYAQETHLATQILRDCGYKTESLKNILKTPMFNLYRFKRIYTNEKSHGVPYLSPSETLMFRPKSERYLSKAKTENLDKLLVGEGWILMTCSGTVGRTIIATKRLTQFAHSHDLIRIIADERKIPTGYLQAFLSTWMAQALITKDRYGLVINHIEPHQIENLAVPQLEKYAMEFFDERIKLAYSMREQANQELDTADDLLYEKCELPREIKNPLDEKKSFVIKSTMLNSRLDASHYHPLLLETMKNLKRSKAVELRKINQVADVMLPDRFKRIYVEKKYGIPFLQGSDIATIRHFDIKYISQKMTAFLEQCLIRSGWVLITRSGTIGRIALSTPINDKWSVTEDIIRIIPKGNLDAGYVATFLTSPYGYNQAVSKIYGAVIDHLTTEDVGEIVVAVPRNSDVHDEISRRTRQAHFLKDLASLIEEEAVKLLENILEGSFKYKNADELKRAFEATIDVKANIESYKDIHDAIREINDGDTISLEDLKSKYGL